jgi:hypothetical protein
MISVSENRFLVWACSTIDRHKLAKMILIPHLQEGGLSSIFQILCSSPNRAERVKHILLTKPARAFQIHMMLEDATFS